MTTVGLYLLLQATSIRYEIQTYSWVLEAPFANGLGTPLLGLREAEQDQIESARTLAAIDLVLLQACGACFALLY